MKPASSIVWIIGSAQILYQENHVNDGSIYWDPHGKSGLELTPLASFSIRGAFDSVHLLYQGEPVFRILFERYLGDQNSVRISVCYIGVASIEKSIYPTDIPLQQSLSQQDMAGIR